MLDATVRMAIGMSGAAGDPCASLWSRPLKLSALTYIAAAERKGQGLDADLMPQRRAGGIALTMWLLESGDHMSEFLLGVTLGVGTALGLTWQEAEELIYPPNTAPAWGRSEIRRDYPAALMVYYSTARAPAVPTGGSRPLLSMLMTPT
jgi:hypothetical protein